MKLNLISLSFLLVCAGSTATHSQTISTVAGVVGSAGYLGDYGKATDAKFNNPRAVATDNSGNLYIADMRNHVIRKVNSTGIISTVAGNGTSGTTTANTPAISAPLNQPTGMAIDNEGNIYIADYNASTVKKVNAQGIMTTFAGNGTEGFGGDGGQAAAAKLYKPVAIAMDNAGNMFISDASNKVIRKVNKNGIITTYAGTPGRAGYSGDGGPATAAKLTQPAGIAVDNAGNLYIADPSCSVIRKVTPQGIISTFAGNGNPGYSGDGGPATKAEFQIGSPQGVAVDNAGNVYASDYQNHVVRKISTSGIITTIAGTGAPDYTGDGGPAISASIWYPIGIATDNAGNIYITDSYNNTIRKIVSCVAVPPTFNVQPGNKDICENGKAEFSISANNAGAYQWQVNTGTGGWNNVTDGGANYSGATTNTLTVKGAGASMNSYEYRCMATNACSNSYSTPAILSVTASKQPSVNIAAANTTICSGSEVTFTATATNAGNNPIYQWQVNGANAGSSTAAFVSDKLANGDVISCMVTSSGGCSAPVASVNKITMNVNTSPSVTASADKKIFFGGRVTLNATTKEASPSYQWVPSVGMAGENTASPMVRPAKTTTYKVMVTGANGCTGTAKVKVTVTRKMIIPNAFTPNGDGINDVFKIPVDNSFTLKQFTVENSKGKVIYETDDITKPWDGTVKGLPAEPGTYSYTITGSNASGKVSIKDTLELYR
jgi:gliding motility-associated-like protein